MEYNSITREMMALGDLFPNGGEVYTQEELLLRIEPYVESREEGVVALIEQAVKAGFIIESTDKVYTR